MTEATSFPSPEKWKETEKQTIEQVVTLIHQGRTQINNGVAFYTEILRRITESQIAELTIHRTIESYIRNGTMTELHLRVLFDDLNALRHKIAADNQEFRAKLAEARKASEVS